MERGEQLRSPHWYTPARSVPPLGMCTRRTPQSESRAGDAACLVDPFSVADIRRGLERVISDAQYREALVERGFENAKRFDRRTVSRQYEGIYRRLAER